MELRSIVEQVMNALADPALLLRPDGTMLAFNRSFCELTQMRPRQLKQAFKKVESPFDILGAEDDPDLFEIALSQRRSVLVQKAKVKHPGGMMTEGVIGFVPLPSKESPRFVIYTLRDLSAEAHTQARLKVMIEQERARADELEERVKERTRELETSRIAAEGAARSKSEFLATMSHELRTPMNAIMGLVALVLDDPVLSEESRDSLRLVEASSQAMLVMLSDVLDFSKIEAGRLELETISFDLPLLVRQVGQLLGVQADAKGLGWGVQLDPSLPRYVEGDPVRLRQVLTNLTNNAVKFTDEGEVVLGARKIGGKIRFEVKDTGIGITDAQQKRIFEKFTQAESSTTRRFGGTGLGLAICQQLVGLMKGQVRVQSEVGKGTNFYFELVMKPGAPPKEASQSKNAQSKLSGLLVLLVEDNPVNQKVAAKMLERFGCSVEVANSGCKALELAKSTNYDVVLMDCQMPGMDGFEATQKIRGVSAAWAKTPIIALTANVQEGVKERCLSAGMDDYLSKPINRNVLGEKLAKWRVTLARAS